jgi:ABC-type lipoprotein release transport system permease subunit
MSKKSLTRLTVVICFCLLLAFFPSHSHAQSSSERIISGQVLDELSDQPIINATVSVWDTFRELPFQWQFVETQLTDGEGKFNLTVSDGSSYRVYVYYDDPSSPGFDYVPSFKDLTPSNENAVITFRLLPAASVLFEGSLWFVESTKPSNQFSFNVVEETTDPTNDSKYVTTYGTSPPNNDFLNTSSNHVIVPVGRAVQIEVNASVLVSNERFSKYFMVDDFDAFNLSKGDVSRINIEKYTSLVNYNAVEDRMGTTTQLLEELSEKGFYTAVEKEDLAHITSLLELAGTKIDNRQYSQAYTDLRESYVANTVLSERLESSYTNAVGSVAVLTFFLALTSITLSLLFFEKASTKYTTYPLFFTVLFALFYTVYPGCQLIPPLNLLTYVLLALGGVAFLTLLLPKILKDKVISTFSISKRNLKRRRNRFILTATTIILLVMSFVSLTSFSTGYGFTTRKHSSTQNHLPDRLFIQELQPATSTSIFTFIPINPSSIDLILEKPEVLLAAPKAENQPRLGYLGSLTVPSTSQRTYVYGVIGIQPSAEAELTGIDSLVVDGRYLRDDDENAVLISEDIALSMGIEAGNTLSLLYGTARQVTVVGMFDSSSFRQAKDIDGKDFAPSRLQVEDPEDPLVKVACNPNEVIIMTLSDATEFYSLPLSRVDILIEAPDESASLAKELALEQGFSVWYSDGTGLYEAAVASFFEERGAFIVIPWIIVILNVLMTMLNSIFEYRKEVSTLSAIGLNPTDITGLFIAEAAVIGFLGGGLGYLLGISNYKVMSMLSIIVEVRPKVSAVWSFASILVSVSAVLVGALAALKYSVDITPSTLRKWTIEGPHAMGTPWVFDIPFRVQEDKLDSLFKYVITRFRRHLKQRSVNEDEGEIRFSSEETPDGSTRTIDFHYLLGFQSNVGSLPFQLVAKKGTNEDTYSFEVICKGSEETVKATVLFIRMAVVEWSSDQNSS